MFESCGLLAATSPLSEVTSKVLFQKGGFVFTNHMYMVTLSTVLLMVVFPLALRRRRLVPHGFGSVIEAICLYIREEVVRPFLHDRTDRYIVFLWTMFFFILTLNLLGLTPLDRIMWLILRRPNHLGGTATANVWVTGALAGAAFLLFHFAGIREQGLWQYIKNFAPRVPWPLMPFIFLMEVVSSFVRMFSLAIRLFANMLAGHVLLATILMLILMFQNYFVATASTMFGVVMSLMEIFVAFLQAYIFVFLTTIFIGLSVHPEH